MEDKQVKSPKKHGLRHLFAASLYSIAGARRLFVETAFRHEVLFAAAIVVFVGYVKGISMHLIALVVLSLILIAVEALNSAIEEIVDHLTDEWAAFAKHAKDLGSFAVLCLLVALGVYALGILFLT